jgi:DNA-binding HxlR family transcriptional regulator
VVVWVRAVPGEQQVGRFRVAVSVVPIARMFAASQWRDPNNAGGGAVFAGRQRAGWLVRQPDPANPQRGLFNLDVHIHDVDSGRPVPYLDVHTDVSRNGTAVLTGLEMVPVAPRAKGVAGLYYGSNVALEETGRHRVGVTIAAPPLTGTHDDEHCEFTVDFDETEARSASQFLPEKLRMHILCYAEKAPIRGAWMAGELARHGYQFSPATLYPALYRMQDEGLLRADQQVVDGRARQVFHITTRGLSALWGW